MRKQFISLLSLLVFGVLTLQAQKASVKLSPEMKLKKSHTFAGHLESDETGHYVYFYKRKSLWSRQSTIGIKKYDTKFNEKWSKDYLADRDDVSSFGLESVKDNFIWLLSEEPKKKTLNYYLMPISKTGKSGKKKKITTIRYEKARDIPSVYWPISEDTTKVGVIMVSDRDKEKLNFEYYVKVVDNNLNDLWSKKVRTSKSQEQVDILSSVMGNDGAHYMLVKEYESRNAKESKKSKGKKRKVAAYDIKIYRLADGNDKPEILKLDLGGKFARGASLKVGENGDITCIGMFSNLKRGNINGVYYLKMNSSGEPITSNMKPFSTKELGYLGDRNRDKDKDGTEGIEGRFSFGEQILFEDGSAVLTAEENYVTSYTDSRGNTRITYHSRDIVVISMDADGKINTLKVIPKKQKTGIQAFNSHAAMPVEGKGVFFFYNDDEDNMGKPLSAKPKRISSFRDCVTASTMFGMDGKLTRKSLVDAKEVKALLLPNACKQINPNTMFFVAMKPKLLGKSNFRMGTIEIK